MFRARLLVAVQRANATLPRTSKTDHIPIHTNLPHTMSDQDSTTTEKRALTLSIPSSSSRAMSSDKLSMSYRNSCK